jgi:nucleotide-binding universal stress UspA family protein
MSTNIQKLKILIPTDFSMQAEFAWLITRKLQERLNAEIHFIHILQTGSEINIDEKGEIIHDGEVDLSHLNMLKDIAKQKFELLRKHAESDLQCHLVIGNFNEKLVDFAHKNQFDLVIMGTKGAFGIKERISGTKTAHVVRNSKIPVLSLMCDRSDLKIRNLMFVHDFLREENPVVPTLSIIAELWNATVHLTYINTREKADKNAIQNKMREFAKINQLVNYEYIIHQDEGFERGVIHLNQMKEYDLLFVGTHGRNGFAQIMHHSKAEKLVNQLFKPIVTFRLN